MIQRLSLSSFQHLTDATEIFDDDGPHARECRHGFDANGDGDPAQH